MAPSAIHACFSLTHVDKAVLTPVSGLAAIIRGGPWTPGCVEVKNDTLNWNLYVPVYVYIGPPLSKKSFPVCRVGKKKSQSGGGESFFLISFFIN